MDGAVIVNVFTVQWQEVCSGWSRGHKQGQRYEQQQLKGQNNNDDDGDDDDDDDDDFKCVYINSYHINGS